MLILDRHNPQQHPARWESEVEEEEREKNYCSIIKRFDFHECFITLLNISNGTRQERWTTSTSTFSSSGCPTKHHTNSSILSQSATLCSSSSPHSLAFARRFGSASDCCSCFYERLVSPLHSLLWSLHVSIPIKSEIKWKLLCSYISSEWERRRRWTKKETRERPRRRRFSTIKVLMSSRTKRKDSRNQSRTRVFCLGLLSRVC